jgi:Na+/H+ antiporter NhaD/arsenite permease-like protein
MAQGGHDGGGVRTGFAGPWCWLACAVAGALVGLALAWALPNDHHGPPPGAVRRPGVVEHGASGESRTLVPLPQRGAGGADGAGGAGGGEAAAGAGEGEGRAGGGVHGDDHGHAPATPLWLCIPFALLLLSIATMPFVNEHFWHRHYPDFAFFFGSIVAAYYLAAMGDHGVHALRHAMTEYYSFIALVGGLYVVSGGILIRFRGRGTPRANTAVLAAGAVLANLVGTTGASVLLIRPYMRMNEGRLRPLHIVFFIFIVSNCGGCLTPIGDPPLYLGFLKGVPFFWTTTHLWPMWLATVGLLLGVFYVYDRGVQRRSGAPALAPAAAAADSGTHGAVTVAGRGAIAALVLLVGGVMIDPALRAYAGVEGIPVGATFQVVVAAAAWRLARREIHEANRFDFHPVREVGLLFVGIFATMIPALEYLAQHGAELGLASPGGYFLGTGVLSAVLDNAPTYLSFVQLSFSVLGLDVSHEGVRRVIDHAYTIVQGDGRTLRVAGADLLAAISLGAVFFGAMTYIGNGPNFMVKSIADASGKVKMPSFFGYAALAAAILGPVLLVVWAVFIR